MENDNGDVTSTRIMADRTPRILVVDDDEMIRTLLREILLPEGYKIDLSESSGSALENLIDYKYNLILLDVNLPGISGHEILRYCKKNLPFTEIIMVTGDPAIDVAVNTVKDGAFDFIQKPFTVDKIRTKVKEALEHQKSNLRKTSDQIVEIANSGRESILPEYEVVRTLGSGNMGVVLLVEKEKRKYAMKILRKEGDNDAYLGRMKRFLREAKILSQIDSPHVVKIFDYGMAKNKNVPFIIMEYVKGNNLVELIKSKSLTLDQKLSIISQIATALETVHEHGILHRDVKPSNVLVTKELETKLMDFGVARISDSSLTMHDEILGSPAYMAPEVFDKRRSLEKPSDIFSLGVLGYELITGEKPFKGETVSEMMGAIQTMRPIEPRKLDPSLPANVQNLLAKMLNKNPKERFQTAGEITTAITEIDADSEHIEETMTRRILRSMFQPGAGRIWE